METSCEGGGTLSMDIKQETRRSRVPAGGLERVENGRNTAEAHICPVFLEDKDDRSQGRRSNGNHSENFGTSKFHVVLQN